MAKTTSLTDRVRQAMFEEVERMDRALRRPDSSGYESYGRLKEELERATGDMKPLQNLLKDYWNGVVHRSEDEELALLREIRREATALSVQFIRVAAVADRAEDSLLGDWEPPEDEEEKPGEAPAVQVDEKTGEVVGA